MDDAAPVARGSDQSLGVRHLSPPFRRGHQVYFTIAEWNAVVEAARACGRTASVFVRETALGALPPIVATAPLLRELCRSGLQLTQLAAASRASGALPQAERLDAVLAELLAVARRLDPSSTPRPRE